MRELQMLFCQWRQCGPSEYEERMFRECLYRHARLLAPWVRRMRPHFFAEDFKFIQRLGRSTEWREAEADLLDFRDANLGRRSFLRNSLRIRVSGRKAGRLVQELFAEQDKLGPHLDGQTGAFHENL